MTVNDLKIDIITALNQLTDIAILKQIKAEIEDRLRDKTVISSIWKGMNVEIRKGVTFEKLMDEQQYQKITFDDFIDSTGGNTWEVTLDELLENSH